MVPAVIRQTFFTPKNLMLTSPIKDACAIVRVNPRLVAAALFAHFLGITSSPAAETKPNFVLIFADDLGWGELGCQGYAKDVPTPHIDSLAQQGIRCINGHVAATFCAPSRAGLLTGRYPTRFGFELNGSVVPLTESTMANRLKDLGYATCMIGKWHLGDRPEFQPTQRGFDEYMGCLSNPGSYSKPRQWVDSLGQVTPGENFYTTDAFAERAVDWIERNQKNPFFLYLPLNGVHAPLEATPKYLARFPHVQDRKRRTFCAMLSAVDDAVGRVVEKLRQTGLEKNTVVVFLSDNGGPTKSTTSSNGPLRGFKAQTSEGGTRVPFLVKWPGVLPAGKVYEKPIMNLDLLPTFVTAAGGKVDPAWKLDGVDMLPFLQGLDTQSAHPTMYWKYGDQWAIIDGEWKMVVSKYDANRPRLIHFSEDLSEASERNTAEPGLIEELTRKWQIWNQEQKPSMGGHGIGEDRKNREMTDKKRARKAKKKAERKEAVQ
jgi:arylsulfatase A-like enzyme